jgi:hypothetical protein
VAASGISEKSAHRRISTETAKETVAFQKRLSDIAPVAASAAHGSANYPGPVDLSGCSSGVEHNLAKVGVEGSNPFARSKFPEQADKSSLHPM